MPVRVVESKDNARLKELRKALASAGRGAQGCVGIEGPHLLEEAFRAGLRVKTIFVAQGPNRDLEKLLHALPVPPDTEILRLPAKLLHSALATETPQPIAALVEPPEWTWARILDQGQKKALVVVLAGIQDPGNLGTIMRSAEAFGASGVLSLPGTVSAWNPKAVRASAGSVFRVPLLSVNERECLEKLHEAGVKVLATTVRGAEPANRVDMTGPVASHHRQRRQRRGRRVGRKSRRKNHDSLPRPGGEPERSRGRQRVALRGSATAGDCARRAR